MVGVLGALPMLCLLVALVYVLLHSLLAALSTGFCESFPLLIRSVPREIANAAVVSWSVMHVLLVSTAFEAWHCVEVAPDRAWRLFSEQSVRCTLWPDAATPHSERVWPLLLTLGVALMLCYGVAVPVVLWRTLRARNRPESYTVSPAKAVDGVDAADDVAMGGGEQPCGAVCASTPLCYHVPPSPPP